MNEGQHNYIIFRMGAGSLKIWPNSSNEHMAWLGSLGCFVRSSLQIKDTSKEIPKRNKRLCILRINSSSHD